MRKFLSSIALAAALSATAGPTRGSTTFGCEQPDRAPVMPQGATASDEEMRQGHDALQAYVKALEAFQACLKKHAAEAPPDTKPEEKAQWEAAGDAAIGAAQRIADIYSAQLRAYKARQ